MIGRDRHMVEMGSVWDRTAEFVSDNLGAILPIALLALFVPASISTNLWDVMTDAAPAARLGVGAALLALGLLSLWGQLALVALTLELGSEGEARVRAIRAIPAAVVTTLVCAVVAALFVAPIGIILAAAGVPMSAPTTTIDAASVPFGALMAVLGYTLVLTVLGLWAMARLVLLVPVIVSEQSWFGAFARSFRLTRGVTFKIIGVVILYFVVANVAGLAARAVFGSIFRLVAGGGEAMSLSAVLTSIVVAVVQTGFTVLSAVFTARLYQALALQHAGVRA